MPSAKGKRFGKMCQVMQSATRYFKEGYLLQWSMMGRTFQGYCGPYNLKACEAVSARLSKSAQAYARGYHAYIRMVSPAKAAQLAAAHPWLARTS